MSGERAQNVQPALWPDVRLVGSVFDVDLGLFSMLPNSVVILPLGRLLRRRIGFTLFQPM